MAGAGTVLGAVVLVDLFGETLQLSHWVVDISPFTHAPKLPGGAVLAAPLLWLCLAAVAFSPWAWPPSAAAISADVPAGWTAHSQVSGDRTLHTVADKPPAPSGTTGLEMSRGVPIEWR